MNDHNDVERRLEAWGDHEPPPVDGAFANRLEADLRQIGEVQRAIRRRPLWQPIVLATASMLIVIVGLLGFRGNDLEDQILVMGVSTQTDVVFPDGSVTEATTGLELPDGTRINVASDGSAVVGEVVLGPGSRAVVVNGRLEILETRRSTTTLNRSTTPNAGDPAATQEPADRESTTTTTAPERTPTTRPSAETSTNTRATQPTATTATTTTATTTTASSTTASTRRTTQSGSTAIPAPTVTLQLAERSGLLVLSWTYEGPDSVAGWEVVAVQDDRSTTLALLRDPTARTLTLEPSAAELSYRVVARTADGRRIAESELIALS